MFLKLLEGANSDCLLGGKVKDFLQGHTDQDHYCFTADPVL